MAGRRPPSAPGARSRAQLVVETLRVADVLRTAARTVEEVAEVTGIHPRTVYRILDALQEAGFPVVVTERPRRSGAGRPSRRYRLEPAAEVRT